MEVTGGGWAAARVGVGWEVAAGKEVVVGTEAAGAMAADSAAVDAVAAGAEAAVRSVPVAKV